MTKKTFLNQEKALLTVMLQCKTPEIVIGRVRNALHCGAEAFGLQTESLQEEYRNSKVYKQIFGEMTNKPVYVTNYRYGYNVGKTDDVLAEELVELADCGATLCDIMGDLFDRQPDELAISEDAVTKQMQLIDKIHQRGAEVLMSSHVLKFTPAEKVLEIAWEHKRRGADIVKIVTAADDMEQQMENLKIASLLWKELDSPFLFLSIGKSAIHRRIGMHLGNCMQLCVYEHDVYSTVQQPLLSVSRIIRDELGF